MIIYLETVREKLRLAKLCGGANPELFAQNIQALELCTAKDIEASEIDVRIGTTWVEAEDYEQFIYELLNTPRRERAVRTQWYNSGIQVHLNKLSMECLLKISQETNILLQPRKLMERAEDAYSIFEDTLNLKTVTIRDRIDDGDGKYHYVVNKNETMLAREKQNQMKEAFKEWLFRDP